MNQSGLAFVEIRSYSLKPGQREAFHQQVVQQAWPMLLRWGVDVLAFGPSPHDETSYYLIRAYDSLEHREASQDAFYGSAEWREGPRESIVSRINNYTSVVLEMGAVALSAIRQPALQAKLAG
ncbi:NIPSNAP family protein [Undibacterium sp. TJN25]|uniref:NIPSNAP family protein n=1 Tax=Undibacterium sp. TJN25 TaxID=3413056 RepID=UPI003BF2A79A